MVLSTNLKWENIENIEKHSTKMSILENQLLSLWSTLQMLDEYHCTYNNYISFQHTGTIFYIICSENSRLQPGKCRNKINLIRIGKVLYGPNQ